MVSQHILRRRFLERPVYISYGGELCNALIALMLQGKHRRVFKRSRISGAAASPTSLLVDGRVLL